MKYLTVCRGAVLALSLAVTSTSAFAQDYVGGGYRGNNNGCYKCPPPRSQYDSQEVIKQTRDIDRSQVIETRAVVPIKRLIETNHLIIRENETRNVGTIQHNHTIIEKETVESRRNVDNKTLNTVINLVENKYNTRRVREVEEREIPGENRDITCNCVPSRAATSSDAYGSARKFAKARY